MTYPGGGGRTSRDSGAKRPKVIARKLGKFKPIIRTITRRKG